VNNGLQYEYFKVQATAGTTFVGGSVYTVCKNAGMRPVCVGDNKLSIYNNEKYCEISPISGSKNGFLSYFSKVICGTYNPREFLNYREFLITFTIGRRVTVELLETVIVLMEMIILLVKKQPTMECVF